MVNKCSAIGCKSLYIKQGKNVKLHRFPLTNTETLPAWVAATGREKEWKPCKSSRLCGNHFQESEYIVGHGKGVLKSTAIPTIDYRIDIPKYQKRKCLNLYTSKLIKVEPTDDTEMDQLNGKDTLFNSKYEHKSYDYGEPYHKKEYRGIQNKIIINNYNSIKLENDEYFNESTTYNNTTKHEHAIDQIREELCNTRNQCYAFTKSFKEEEEEEDQEENIIPSDEISLGAPSDMGMNIDHSTADSNFNKIMALKLRKQRRTKDIYSLYFQTMAKNNILKAETVPLTFFNNDELTFVAFIEAQLKELYPYQNIYLATKHKIQKLLMKAQLKIATQQSI